MSDSEETKVISSNPDDFIKWVPRGKIEYVPRTLWNRIRTFFDNLLYSR